MQNYPLISGTGDKEFLEAVDKAIARARMFQPDVVAVSAGFDAYYKDKLLGLQLSLKAYYECAFRLRRAFPKARLRVRLDGGFAAPALFEFLEAERLEYVVAMGKNAVLEAKAEPLMAQARARSAASGRSERHYGECRYAAKTWKRERRVVIKAEVVRLSGREPKDNPRFVVTNLRGRPQRIYEQSYCQRAHIENRIKELHDGLAIDRTSCSRFWANQFRALLTAAAYALFQELRLHARGTALARAQVSTLRLNLLKLGAWVERSVRRTVLHLPDSAPWRTDWCRIARSLGAAPN